MKTETCGNCDAFVPDHQLGQQPKQGQCRAKSPVVMLAGVSQGRLANQLQPQFVALWPAITADSWCREWHPNLEASAEG